MEKIDVNKLLRVTKKKRGKEFSIPEIKDKILQTIYKLKGLRYATNNSIAAFDFHERPIS